MSQEQIKTPKAFTSYSRTSTEHTEWVRQLVDRVRNDGVEMTLDTYKLKEGQDKYVFMEQMVTDPNMSKVLVICDKRYAERADARKGGVGTESMIISQEIYEKVDQNKFIPVVTEFDENGKPYLPTFMKGRIYIDLSSEEKLAENYEQLLRALFDKPIHIEPPVGKPPSFLTEEAHVSTRTSSKLQMLKDAVRKDRLTVKGLIVDYLRSFEEGVAADFRIKFFPQQAATFEKQNRQLFRSKLRGMYPQRFKTEDYDGAFGEKVKSSIHRFLPYRDEFIDFILFISLYIDDPEIYKKIFQLFESMLPYQDAPRGTGGYDHLGDNFRFILREMFLYLIAALIKNDKFQIADTFMRQEYFNGLQWGDKYHESHAAYTVFNTDSRFIETDRFGQTTGGTGKLLHERASHSELNFDRLMEADFILFLRSILDCKSMYDWFWHPRTIIRAQYHGVFPLFAKAESRDGFNNLKVLLGVISKQELEEKFNRAIEGEIFKAVSYRADTIKRLMNFEKLDSRP